MVMLNGCKAKECQSKLQQIHSKEQGKIWRDEVEEDLNMMGIKNRQAMARKCQEWRRIVLEAKVHNGL
jgi:hypothetical protein